MDLLPVCIICRDKRAFYLRLQPRCKLDTKQIIAKISAKIIAAEIGIASRNVEADIKFLRKTGIIKRVGSETDIPRCF